jgi:hypothetical protein
MKGLHVTLGKTMICYYAECRILIVMLNVITLNVIILSVVAPSRHLYDRKIASNVEIGQFLFDV